jgi:N-carbamoylputrescine amidase
MRHVTVAATQFACTWDLPANADRAEALVRQAAGQGAQIVLIQELLCRAGERAWRGASGQRF